MSPEAAHAVAAFGAVDKEKGGLSYHLDGMCLFGTCVASSFSTEEREAISAAVRAAYKRFLVEPLPRAAQAFLDALKS